MDYHPAAALTILLIISFILILISGIFSLFENALILCRKTRLEKERPPRYKEVLDTMENRQNILLACRLWINFLRIFAALFTGITFVFIISNHNINNFSTILLGFAMLVLGLITTLLGDALPKLLSCTKPEKITAALLPVIKILSFPMMLFTLPVLKLSSLFNSVFRPEIDENHITEEELQDELRSTLLEGEKSGIVESKERTMVEGVFYLGDRTVGAFMTHRSEIQWFDINTDYNEVLKKAIEYRTQRCFPVADGNPDEIAGAVYLEDILLDMSQPQPQGLRVIMKKAQFVPETMTAVKAFESFKQGQVDFLFVMDEYGGLAGIISIRALVEEIVGELSVPAANKQPLAKQEDGSYLADGTLNIDDAVHSLSLTGLPEGDDFHTLAGFILYLAGELPGTGDSYEYQGYKFIIKEMDGNRIDKILIIPPVTMDITES